MISAILAILLATITSVSGHNVVSLDIHKRDVSLSKRATVTEELGNANYLYWAQVSIGRPPQMIQLQIDTGSTDVWMTQLGNDFCQQNERNCIGGTFDPTQSSSYTVIQKGGFNISYVDDAYAAGDFFTDQFSVGDITLDGLEMGLATQTSIGTGVLGLSFASDESVCNQDPCRPYPTIMEQLVKQKKINSKAFSLWLNDLGANTGNVLFGGVDLKKYSGDLVTLPIVQNSEGSATAFYVAWTGFSIDTPQGQNSTNFVSQNFDAPAILDSGTTSLLLPDDIAPKVFDQFGAEYVQQYDSFIAPCSLLNTSTSLSFQFGGSDGPTIKLPISQLLTDPSGQNESPISMTDGSSGCLLGFQPANGRPLLLGDTFLRSAYVVFDIDNQEVSIAQTVFNADESEVLDIQAGPGGVPGVTSTATGGLAKQTVTAAEVVGAEGTASPTKTEDGGKLPSGTGKPALAVSTTTASTDGSPSQGAAPLFIPTMSSYTMFIALTAIMLGTHALLV